MPIGDLLAPHSVQQETETTSLKTESTTLVSPADLSSVQAEPDGHRWPFPYAIALGLAGSALLWLAIAAFIHYLR
jgi:hypothetical protein